MGRVREISAIAYASVEILHAAGAVLMWGAFRIWGAFGVTLVEYVGYLGIASWLAFIVFAAAAFKQFSYRWLRVVVAFLVFYFLPIAGAVLYGRNTHSIPLEWMFVSLRALLIGIFVVKLAIAGFIYVWSVRHERAGLVAQNS